MWLIVVALALLASITLHAVVVRAFPGASRPVSFLVVGSVIGVGMIGALASRHGFFSVRVVGATLTYAFACELYLFLFSSALTSISMNLLVRLLGRPMNDSEVSKVYDSRRMVARRIERLLATGLMQEPQAGRYEVTGRGAQLLRLFSALARFFRNTTQFAASEQAPPPREEPAPPLGRQDVYAVMGVAGLAAWLFRDHLLRNLTFLGNPDRIHNNLKVLKFHVDNITQGIGLQAWNEHELLGYDSFALPYINPNPLTYLVAAFGTENLYVTAGYVSALLLALAGVGAYFFLRDVVCKRLPAAAGASLYLLASITVLKVSQNDASFLVFVLIPPLLLAARRASPEHFAQSVGVQAFLLYLLLQFTFLQKAAYALLLWGAYAVFLAGWKRQPALLAIPTIAFAGAFVAALPRILGVALAMAEYTRGSAKAMAQPVLSHPMELLRWFDGTIFGRYFGDTVWNFNAINLSEGFLLYTSALVPFVLLSAAFRASRHASGERWFFVVLVAALFSVIAVPSITKLVWLAFAKINFIHARILIAALLPLVALVALRFRDLAPQGAMGVGDAVSGVVLGVSLVAMVELAAEASAAAVPLPADLTTWFAEMALPVAPLSWTPVAIDRSAVVRIGISGMVVLALVLVLRSKVWLRAKNAAYVGLVSATVMQALLGSNFQLNGQHTRGGEPFRSGNIGWVEGGKFTPPSPEQRAGLNQLLDNQNSRSIAICDRRIAGGFCAGHLSEFWKLRLADGYYGFGAPARAAVLPWRQGLGMRDLSYGIGEMLQWPLLGFMNVGQAVVSSPDLYGNGKSSPSAAGVVVLHNRATVLPRAFFVQNLEPVTSARHAVEKIFDGDTPRDVRRIAYAEGITGPATYLAEGRIAISGGGDRLVAEFEPASLTRFLVVNELYSPGWYAEIRDRRERVYAVNAIMRGVVVPSGTTRVEFLYRPLASLLHCLAALMLGAALVHVSYRYSRNWLQLSS